LHRSDRTSRRTISIASTARPRDGRFALHSWPKPFVDDGFDDEEFNLAGRARMVDDDDMHERVSKAVGDNPSSGRSFELDIDRALHKSRLGGLRYEIWHPEDPAAG
jgi:hypothetical protein